MVKRHFLTVVVLARVASAQAVGPSGYVDPKVCAQCHGQIAENYAKTGMGRAFYRPSAGAMTEDYAAAGDVYHALSDSHYSMIRREGQYFQRRWQRGVDGSDINVEETRIDYVMGSGNGARSYLHRTDRGMLIELPLGWYSNREGTQSGWAMVPGSDNAHPFTRRYVSYKCMFCHNGYPSIPEGHEAAGSEPVFTGALPEGIDCQRCHGPGAAHLAAVAKKGATPASIRASIVNPARLSAKLQMDSCMQCHLETTSGRIPAVLQKFDRGTFSYRPGEPLEDFALSFDHAPGTGHEGKFEAINSAYRLRQARCFLESAGRMTCLTCHDPHNIPKGDEAVQQYTTVCRTCHAAGLKTLVSAGKHVDGGNCIACHMPKRRVQDAPHVVMTDHLIQRRADFNGLALFPEAPAEEYRGEVVPYYPAPLPDTDLNRLYRAVAQVGLENNVAGGLPDLQRLLAALKPPQAEFYTILGAALHGAGRNEEAIAAYRDAVRMSGGGMRELLALASVLPAAEAAAVLEEARRKEPANPEPVYQAGLLDAAQGRLSDAVEKMRRAIALDPTMPQKSRSLAGVLLRLGRTEEALAASREALRTDPFDDAAWDVQGKALAEQGSFAEAFFDFERATRLHPRAEYFYDHALALVRADRFDEARERAESAVRASSGMVEAHELLAGLHVRNQEWAQAAAEYRSALATRPDLARDHLRLGNALAAQGDRAGAAEEWRAAAGGNDPAVASQASQLLRQAGIR